MSFRYKHGDRPLEGYTVLRGIGKGGFGEVYYAVSDGGRQVALKCLYQGQEIELRGVGQCMNLKCPRLVTIFDVRTGADGAAHVIMEHIAGPSLRALLAAAPGGLGTAVATYLVRELCEGLAFLHDKDIVHRDLKPENVFIENGAVKVGDYSLSKHISITGGSCHTISVGTVHYMAPEIGSGRYHRGIDIYALGVIFYELLTGSVPFTGDSVAEIIMKHVTAEPDYSRVPSCLVPVLRKALAKSPAERHLNARDVIADLEAVPETRAWLAAVRPESLTHLAWAQPQAETVALGASGAGAEAPFSLEASSSRLSSGEPGPPLARPSASSASPASPAAPGGEPDLASSRSQDPKPLRPEARVLLLAASSILLVTTGILLFEGLGALRPGGRNSISPSDPYCLAGAVLTFVFFLLGARFAWSVSWPGAIRATRLFIVTSILGFLAAGFVFYGALFENERTSRYSELNLTFFVLFLLATIGILGHAAYSRWRARLRGPA